MQFIIMATICPSDNQQLQATKATTNCNWIAFGNEYPHHRGGGNPNPSNLKIYKKWKLVFLSAIIVRPALCCSCFLVVGLFYCIMSWIWLWLFNRGRPSTVELSCFSTIFIAFGCLWFMVDLVIGHSRNHSVSRSHSVSNRIEYGNWLHHTQSRSDNL